MITGNELREKFLQFFASKEHLILPSAPLVPENDPTLLLIGAGMAPFKPFFTGKMTPPKTRITTSQKCVRTGDIENVGRTARHHTFFEMLGNFSFGDYFKREAITWSWEFLTKELGLPADKLWITVYTEDDEAFAIWRDEIGVPEERIVRLEDNFWEIGPGPCGPCSEIHVDLGESRGCGKPDCKVGCECDRYLEIWNLVFTQFNKEEDGSYSPLEKKNIDTGAGLERLASVLQHKPSNFETDLIFPIIEYAAKTAGVAYNQSPATDISLKVIADHARSVTVMIGDGILPSNEGRGYVLRRVLRRAVRHGRLLGIKKPFLVGAVDVVLDIFQTAYPELQEKAQYIKRVIQQEEERFHTTLEQGSELLSKEIAVLKEKNITVLDGETAFKLYDTFGFPWELTEEIAAEENLTMDRNGFEAAMTAQRERARAARQEKEGAVVIPNLSGFDTASLRFDADVASATIVGLFQKGKPVSVVHDGDEAAFILDVTPFHPEGGGQVTDTGFLQGAAGKVEVLQARKLADGTIYQQGIVTEGSIDSGEKVSLTLDKARKQDIARNHTATHLLHAALKQVLGEHVNQAGSYVGTDRLRFDFSHFAPVTPDELKKVETIVNEQILQSKPVDIIETDQESAKAMGAMALFGEKYGKIVRVVTVQDFSSEFCGGSHVKNIAEIGLFKILSETSTGAGVRRIEAVTGRNSLAQLRLLTTQLEQTANLLKCRPEEVSARVEQLQQQTHDSQQALEKLESASTKQQVDALVREAQDIKGVRYLTASVTIKNIDELRQMGDMARDQLGAEGVVILGAASEEKVQFLVMASKGAVGRGVHAGQLVKAMAVVTGGGGGGRPDMAQAGGRMPEKLPAALAEAVVLLEKQIK